VTATELAETYFRCIRAQDLDGLAALYDDDAIFILPNCREFTGKPAIRALHQSVFAPGAPIPTPLAMIAGDDAIAVEIAARLPDGTGRNTANFYTLTPAGRIKRLSVYIRTG
jgi:ketosteroid isomerase-like protein